MRTRTPRKRAFSALAWLAAPVRSLRGRFFALLLGLGVLALGPWLVSSEAHHNVRGFARELDLAGSLRYRLLEIEEHLARSGPNPDQRRQEIEGMLRDQRATLVELIHGNSAEGVPPCPDARSCARMRGHLDRWDHLLAPRFQIALDQGLSPGTAVLAHDELRALDGTVRDITDSLQTRAAAINRFGTAAGVASFLLVALIGFGVWEVFGGIRRLRAATQQGSEQALQAEAAGDNELATLARALSDGLRAARAGREADRRHLEELREQQDATANFVQALNGWISGVSEIDPVLEQVARVAGYQSARLGTAGGEAPDAAAELLDDSDRLIPLAWRDESLCTLVLHGGSAEATSRSRAALVETLTQVLTLACLARRVLAERERRAEIAGSLASVASLGPGPSVLGESLFQLVRYDRAQLTRVDDAGRPVDSWQITPRELKLLPLPDSVDVPEEQQALDSAVASPRAPALLLLPLKVGGQTVGVVTLERTQGAFSSQECETAKALEPVLASALLRMQLTERLRVSEQWTTIGAFGRMLADELRNPLNGLSLQVQLFERRLDKLVASDEDRARLTKRLGAIHDELSRMETLLSEYLSLHPTAGELKLEQVDLAKLLSEMLDTQGDTLLDQDVELEPNIWNKPALVIGNPARLRSVVDNLLRNAVEAMQNMPTRRLGVSLERAGSEWELVIRDTGPGIDDPIAIFSPGYTTKPSGTGMGLPLTLHTVLQHQGRLVARLAEGGGSEFVLTLPAAEAPGLRAGVRAVRSDDTESSFPPES